jgi:hypothetical protein
MIYSGTDKIKCLETEIVTLYNSVFLQRFGLVIRLIQLNVPSSHPQKEGIDSIKKYAS